MDDKARMINWQKPKTLFVYPWKGKNAYDSFAPLADQPYSLFFDSNREGHPLNRYSYLCWQPFETIESKNGRVTITNKDNQFTYRSDAFVVVRERLSLWADMFKADPSLPPFQGGAAGFFGYDLGRGIESIPSKAQDDADMPDMCIGIYDKIITFDHQSGQAFLMIHADDEKSALVHKAYLESLVSAQKAFQDLFPEWKTDRDDVAYKKNIATIIEYIYAGDIFQANLSRRFTASLPSSFDAYAHYGHLRQVNSAPFSAFMSFGDIKLASCSPERFLSVNGRSVETRPIKGTLPSNRAVSELRESEKDCAENAMIVDLLRNDLSKVCEDHSIEVQDLFTVETFEGLHHLVSTVTGNLRADQSAADLLRACFPGGSITGAPKIRAMEIIEQLEPHRRGTYCGSMGYIGFSGVMDTNIIIRTLVYNKGMVSLQTGGGIVADSDPQQELQETLTKADALFRSFTSSKSEAAKA